MRLILYNFLERILKKLKTDVNAEKLNKEELEFLPDALEVVKTPPSPIGRAVVWLLVCLFTIAVIWAYWGNIDEVAVAEGKVIPSGYTKTIQVFDTGVVKNIHIQDGSKVKAGDVLIELDTTLTSADLARMAKEQAFYQLEIQRLTAEQLGQSFSPAANENVNSQDRQNELQLYNSRMADYQTKLAASEQAVSQSKATLESTEATKQKLVSQLVIINMKEHKMKELLDIEAVGEFQYLDYKQQRIGFEQDIFAADSEISKNNHAVLQAIEASNNIVTERQQDVMTKLVESRHQLQSVEEELRKAEEKYRLSTITAPIDGTVQQLAVHTVGGVVTPAQALMLIVPEDAQMEIEAWVTNKDIGFLYEGQKAEIKVETFNFQKYGTLEAELISISSDAVEDKDKGLVYRALLKVDKAYFDLINDRRVNLSPGMAITAEIKTRQKRVIEYFMDPFIKYKSEGLRER